MKSRPTEKQLKKTSITVDPVVYEQFKQIAKTNHSDASKELRKFMEEYVARDRRRNNSL